MVDQHGGKLDVGDEKGAVARRRILAVSGWLVYAARRESLLDRRHTC